MSEAIVKEAQYTLKPSSVKAKRYTRVVPSLGNNPSSGYSMGDTIIFYLPSGLNNQMMDGQTAYLRFTLKCVITATGAVAAGAQGLAMDYVASSIIRRIDIYGSGGALISSVDRYNVLMTALYDIFHSQSELKGLSPLLGNDAGDTTTALNRLGRALYAPSVLMANGDTNTTNFNFAIPLITPITSGCSKYLPVYALEDDIRVEVILDTQANAFVIPTVANSSVACTILNPAIVVDYIELESGAMEQIKSLYAGRDLVLHCEDWHTYETTIADTTTGSWNTILPSKLMSAKCALFAFRRLGITGVAAGYTLSSRSNPFTGASSTFNLNIGGNRVPQRPITVNIASDIVEFYAELKKSYHAFNHIEFSGDLPHSCYTSTYNPAVGDLPSIRGFLAGINLDSLRGQSDVLLSGTDLSKVTTYIEANFTTGIAGLHTLDTFVKHDSLLVIDPNGKMTSKF